MYLLAVGGLFAGEPPQKYALIVGIAEYDNDELNLAPPQFAEADARALSELLSWAGYRVDLLLGEAATRPAIRQKFRELVLQDNPDGVVVVGIFGHGIDVDIFEHQRGATAEGFFCPVDATARVATDAQGRSVIGTDGQAVTEPDPQSMIGLNELMAALKSANARHRVVFADCSHTSPEQLRRRTFGSSFKATDLPQNTAVLFGSSPNQRACESEAWGHGAFTKCLVQEMQNLYVTGNVTTGALGDRVKKNLPQLVASISESQHQNPRMFATNSIDLQFTRLMSRHAFVGRMAGEGKELLPGMNFHWCPLGRCMMGSPKAESDRHKNEDQVDVALTGFWLGETEVTQGQWESLMRTRPWTGKTNVHTGRLMLTMVVKEGIDYAATYISHGDRGDGTIDPDSASDFCRRLTEQERNAGRLPVGWKYSLPTEAQWEYACRAGTTTRFSFGDEDKLLSKYGWWGAKYGGGSSRPEPYPNRVAIKKPNQWGFYDMHGNVWEWCADYFVDQLPGGRDPIVLTGGSMRVCRGGCWIVDSSVCRSALRSGGSPDNRNSVTGFRVAAVPVRD